jgi:NTP pyrophosphatase (non-canonical NTP hydrolase)
MKLTLNELINQATTDSHRWFPGKAQELPNQVLCMAGEVGEVANLVKKNVRGSISHDEMMAELPNEVIDVLIYLVNLMGNPIFSHIDWGTKWDIKREFNEQRFGGPDEIIVGVGTLARPDSERYIGE